MSDLAIFPDGRKEWRQDGELHRVGGPAIIYPDSGEWWYLHGQLHRDDGPAITCANGLEEWWLWGVSVKKAFALSDHSQITPDMVLEEPTVQRRILLLRLMEIARMVPHGNLVDEWGGYRLLDMVPVLGEKALYLQMANPSTGQIHLEGVDNNCRTVREALHSRKPPAMRDIPVSPDGEAWFQQGDVCIWPEGALVLQEFPLVLT